MEISGMKRFLLTIFIIFLSLQAWSQENADFIRAEAQIEVIPQSKSIEGVVHYTFNIPRATDSILLDARHMEILSVNLKGKANRFKTKGKKLVIYGPFKKGSYRDLKINYRAVPDEAVYFIGWDDEMDLNKQVWTQGQGKYTSHWLPSIDDMNDKIEFDLTIKFDSDYDVLVNGRLIKKTVEGDKTTWQYDMDKPMSSYLLAFAIGKYEALESKVGGIPIKNYYYPGEKEIAKATYRHTDSIMKFLLKEIGVSYPWYNYEQVPVRDFLYAGMENTGLTLFSEEFLIDSIAFVDKNYVNVNAHEMAHQWFGNLVTEVDGKHHWLHEGFATYYALLSEREVFGVQHYSWQLFNKAQMLNALTEAGEGEALMDPGASSATFYDKGAWAVTILRNILGDDNYRLGIKTFLNRFAFRNATVGDLLQIMEETSGQSLDNFKKYWLRGEDFLYEEALDLLKEINPEFEKLQRIQAQFSEDSSQLGTILEEVWDEGISTYMKCHLVRNYYEFISPELRSRIIKDSDEKVRQSLLMVTEKIEEANRTDFEALLNDPSYLTQEYALFFLWVNFPEHRENYLDQLKGVVGMPDRNVEMLWLFLASLTEGYAALEERILFIDRLRDYTNPRFSADTRQRAFSMIEQAGFWTEENLADLILATSHHQWQFRQWARKMLDRLWKDEQLKKRLLEEAKKLKDKEIRYISSKSISQ